MISLAQRGEQRAHDVRLVGRQLLVCAALGKGDGWWEAGRAGWVLARSARRRGRRCRGERRTRRLDAPSSRPIALARIAPVASSRTRVEPSLPAQRWEKAWVATEAAKVADAAAASRCAAPSTGSVSMASCGPTKEAYLRGVQG